MLISLCMADLCEAMEKFGKGIGSVSRYRILEALFTGPKTVNQLVKKTKFSQPLVSQHLRVLKETNLVKDDRQGQEVIYSINLQYIISLLKDLIEELKKK